MSLRDALRAPDVDRRRAAIHEIVRRGTAMPDELDALAECLGDGRKAVERPAADAFAALARAGVAVEPVLDAALRSVEPRRRWGAAYALSLLGPPPAETIPILLEALGVDDGDVRWAAAAIVTSLPPARDLADRLVALARDGSGAGRKMALYCLRDRGERSPAVEATVLAALDDADVGVRLAAMASAPRLVADRATAAARLVAALGADDERVRRAAAAALGPLGERTDAVLGALRSATDGHDASLRRAAERSLRLLGAVR